jgi:hypothetical protein
MIVSVQPTPAPPLRSDVGLTHFLLMGGTGLGLIRPAKRRSKLRSATESSDSIETSVSTPTVDTNPVLLPTFGIAVGQSPRYRVLEFVREHSQNIGFIEHIKLRSVCRSHLFL